MLSRKNIKALRFVHKHKAKGLTPQLAAIAWRKLVSLAERDPQVVKWAEMARDNYRVALLVSQKSDRQLGSFENMFGNAGHGYENITYPLATSPEIREATAPLLEASMKEIK